MTRSSTRHSKVLPATQTHLKQIYSSGARGQNVTAAMGVTPVILSFARYIKRKYGKKPADIWKTQALFCTSVPIVEMYTATEGVFGQQLDDLPYITPNYDSYFLEVATGKGVKMLHELKRGEWSRIIISSCMFPRYDIGDLIEAAGKNYFRVFGRKKTLTVLEQRIYRAILGWIV
jgi:hypothetical protein